VKLNMRKKSEADKSNEVMKWFLTKVGTSCPVEIKHTRGKEYFNMRELKEHQKAWLLLATTDIGSYWKIPDTGYGYNPFDYLLYKNSEAYIIIIYPDVTWAISIHDIIKFKGPKLSNEEACNISSYGY